MNKDCFANATSYHVSFLAGVVKTIPDGAKIISEMLKGNYKIYQHFMNASAEALADVSEEALAQIREELCVIYQEAATMYHNQQEERDRKLQAITGKIFR